MHVADPQVRRAKVRTPESKEMKRSVKNIFPVVGIGASAGGLEAVKELFKHLPPDTGMSFVFIQHLDPTHASSLPEILSRTTRIPVIETSHDLRLKPDHIFVIPPNKDITVSNATLFLSPRNKSSGLHLPIDTFLQTLAEDKKGAAVGVILSGTGSDGVLGLRAIKSEGGITFAQDSESAKYAAMPENAIAAGVVDFVLSPRKIADELVKLSRFEGRAFLFGKSIRPGVGAAERGNHLRAIIALLRESTGVDFSHYNPNMIVRRIFRRMALAKTQKLEQYAESLLKNPSEARALYEDIFIHVTNFFRDPDRFEVLKSSIYPAIAKNKKPGEAIRIWCAGCSTGEEAYSLAITLLEYLGSKEAHIPIQIFATDISETAINKARAATYPANIEAHVSPERLKRFFVKQEGGYQISKAVRELCIFTKHDVTKDPPFSRLDLISCSNVLIYFSPPMQRKILSIFHYALKPSGFLILGKSESVGRQLHFFEPTEVKHKIYSRKKTFSPNIGLAYSNLSSQPVMKKGLESQEGPENVFDLQKQVDQLVLSRYRHRGVIVDENMKIVQFRGIMGPLLDPASGEATLDLIRMLHKDLRVPLRVLIQKARKENQAVVKKNVQVKIDRTVIYFSLEVIPVANPRDREKFFLVLLEEEHSLPKASQSLRGKRAAKPGDRDREIRIVELQQELQESREYLQSMIEQHEVGNEKLDAANEELQSANEELQSANEELETAKEELESSNEELNTVNEELQNRNLDLEQLNKQFRATRDYAEAIIKTMREPFVVLDSTLKVKSGNAAFYRTFKLDPNQTLNRYLFDLVHAQWNIPRLRPMLENVLVKGVEFQDYETEGDFPGIGTRTLSLNARRISEGDGREELILLAIGDITHQKELDAAHDVMLQEVHHRVKNSLQLISSLLSLQAPFIHDENALALFKESANRIRSIAFIHEKLHQAGKPATVNFKEYVFDLANSLFGFYGLDPKKITLSLDLDDVLLPMKRAVPCGLILNELITNAMKYAFPADRKGEIHIELKQHRDVRGQKTSSYGLTVRDSGIGIPTDFNLEETTTLGMRIIRLLTKQIDGTLEMQLSPGTTFHITFPQ